EVLHLATHGPPTARQRSGSRLGALALAKSSTSPNGSASSAPAGGGMDQGDGQHAPPTAGPALCRGRAQWGWGALDAKPEQEAKELLALVVPAAPDLSGEHDEPLRAAAREFRVACDFAPAGSVEGDPRARVSPVNWAACANEGGHECRIATQSLPSGRRPVDDEVETAAVFGPALALDENIREDIWCKGCCADMRLSVAAAAPEALVQQLVDVLGGHVVTCPLTGLLARCAKIVERAWVRVDREAVGAKGQVVPQQWLARTTTPDVPSNDRKRLDFMVYGATAHGGSLCCDAILVSPLTRTGHPQPCTVEVDGAVLKVAERRKGSTYPELARGPQRLLVPGSEIGLKVRKKDKQLIRVRVAPCRLLRPLPAAAKGGMLHGRAQPQGHGLLAAFAFRRLLKRRAGDTIGMWLQVLRLMSLAGAADPSDDGVDLVLHRGKNRDHAETTPEVPPGGIAGEAQTAAVAMASLTRDSLAARMLQRGTLPAWELLGKVAKAAPSLWSPSMSSAPSNARADQVVPSHNNKAAFSPGAPHNRKPRSVDSEPLSEPAERTSASSSSIAGFRQHLRASLSGLSSVFRSPSKRKVGKQRPSHLPTIAASRAVVSMASTAKKLPPPPVSTPAEPPERVAKKQAKEQAKEAFAKSRPIKPRHRKVGKQRPSYLAPVGDIMKLPRPLGPLGANPGTAADPGPASQRQAPVEDRSALSPAETHTQTQAKAESCAPSVPGMSELRPEAADVEARLDVVKAKDQLWGQLSQEGIVRSPCLEGQPEPSPAPSSLSPKKPRTSTGKKRSLDQAAEVPKPPAAPAPSDLPQPTRGLSSIAAKQRMTKQHRPITKRVKLEQAKLEEDNYEISDLEEDLHGNRVEPDRSRKRIPAWCTNYVQTAEMQAEVDPDSIFGSHMPICDLEVIFPDSFYRGSTPIKRRRGSSCNWYRDGLTQREVNAYALKMGQKRSWSTAKSSFTLASSRISKADIPLPPVLAKVKVEAAPAKPTSCDQ
ncbi:unnamed protein product, partial [Symbiodinium sp. KB8]